MLSKESVKRMLGAGLGPISVRLRTELAVEAWHWNPAGNWSDPKHQQGYWTSDFKPDPKKQIQVSYGYKLPRRGNTLDEANDDGYSRLDDGDAKTYWKSNPYLCKPYTGVDDSLHPQWVVLDFGKKVPLNSINIRWGEPYAKCFRVEYADRGRVYFGGHPWNVWHSFPNGVITDGKGGEQFLQFSKKPLLARYLRIWMTESSGIAPKGSGDPRDGMGYAIREIMAGEAGQFDFNDHVVHQPGKKQTITYASSTDPWHRACDRDPKVEQPGIDLLARCGITRGLPLMLALPVLYDTPENAAGLAAYAQHSGYPVSRHELGEEPDGQRIDPRDFGVLYAQVSRRVRKALPSAVMGGPSFVTLDVESGDDQTYRFDKSWWIRDFLDELKRSGQSRDFSFISFEWYPFDEVDDVDGKESEQLLKASGMLLRTMRSMHGFHLPLVIGEYNYSVFPCRQEVDLGGALLNVETAAQFLCGGGNSIYYYGYEPNKLDGSSGSWGNQLMLLEGKNGLVPVATYQALKMMNWEWLDPNSKGKPHQSFPVHLSGYKIKDLLSVFALKRPDNKWSLLMINKDPTHPVRLIIRGRRPWAESARLITYSADQYSWQASGPAGHPKRNLPACSSTITGKVLGNQGFTLPPWSLSVLRSE